MRKRILVAAIATAMAGCQAAREERLSQEMADSIRKTDSLARESRTLSGLAKIEESIAAYLRTERKIPPNIELLIPKYLAEVPSVDIPVRGHKETNGVKIYDARVLRDGKVDGSQVEDGGGWGYVFNDRQVVVFVDCTHPASNGQPWYSQKGAY